MHSVQQAVQVLGRYKLRMSTQLPFAAGSENTQLLLTGIQRHKQHCNCAWLSKFLLVAVAGACTRPTLHARSFLVVGHHTEALTNFCVSAQLLAQLHSAEVLWESAQV